MLNQAEEVAKEIEDYWDATEEFSRDDKNQAGFIQLVKALRNVENLMGCHTTLERVLARRANEKCIKDSDFNPRMVNRDNLVDPVIGVGESATKKLSVGLNKST